MDACDAELNAFSYENTQNGESCFPKSNFLMCWFHVEFNVGKQITKKQVPEELVSMIKADINIKIL